jgi:quinone-modifying oxidoreductase subunit QmoC
MYKENLFMSERKPIEPDVKFIKKIREAGGDSLKNCYQCATCSSVCNLSPAAGPFPRKEMIWAQWGLSERLLGDPDVWLCHQCNDCSTNCPRGAKPGDVLAAIRKYTFEKFAFPGFLGDMISRPSYLPVLFIIPVILLLAVLMGTNHLYFPGGEVVYAKFVGHATLNIFFITGTVFALAMMAISLGRFWIAMDQNAMQFTHVENRRGFIPSLFATITEIITHKKFGDCGDNTTRQFAHLITFYGFIALALAAGLGAVALIGFDDHPPYSFTHPVKLVGNLGAVLFFIGTSILFFRRLTGHEKSGSSSYQDWLFLGTLYVVGITGILLEVFRLSGIAEVAYSTFFIHLVLIFVLLVYMPYSKFAHFSYRFTALLWARMRGRGEPAALQYAQLPFAENAASPQQVNQEAEEVRSE